MTRDPVLVAYGSHRGGTAEIAQWIGETLRSEHLEADVRSARDVRSLDDYGAVVLGGALYAGRWHRHARRFARRFLRQLRERPVWVFGSGPLDDSADRPDPPRIPGSGAVRKTARRLDARGATLFGGRLAPDARGFPAAAMAKNHAGDFRNRERIDAWATDIAHRLTRQTL
ncbi:menaquinone-dependent protoporphyrinogen oxidase [Nocardia transvalensis]|uniref:Menaquinone-dependent protoporphyrinogen oxidase n=1 Tax=Nocardia transvalensis TaxID=37333 RepID=A0A7W9PI79_9NOCA|nr:flavodoxin domain-containing protein [Nocardia transvalensis]MBB5916168.1 menaquinone-dependent protoporphyrinogen oxidase [Nocardia transvalensis]